MFFPVTKPRHEQRVAVERRDRAHGERFDRVPEDMGFEGMAFKTGVRLRYAIELDFDNDAATLHNGRGRSRMHQLKSGEEG